MFNYFLGDDSLSVFEPRRGNSGLPGGVFAERARMRRPGGGPLDYYRPQDMQVGARVTVNARVFELTDADEATLKLMEAQPQAFACADAHAVRACGATPRFGGGAFMHACMRAAPASDL